MTDTSTTTTNCPRCGARPGTHCTTPAGKRLPFPHRGATPLTTKQLLYNATTEREWQDNIVIDASLHGWRAYHTHDSRHSPEGFPDLVLVRPPQLLIVECKTEVGTVEPEQQQWLDDLGACNWIAAGVFRPSDRDAIHKLLATRKPPRTRHDPDPVGLADIATRLEVSDRTAQQWQHRELLPDPKWTVSGRPAWNWPDIYAWALETNRLPNQPTERTPQ